MKTNEAPIAQRPKTYGLLFAGLLMICLGLLSSYLDRPGLLWERSRNVCVAKRLVHREMVRDRYFWAALSDSMSPISSSASLLLVPNPTP